jgi:uncharacterized protein
VSYNYEGIDLNMEIILSDMEIRVLGSLIEKEFATPDYYPLSLNALTNACNQKSNRDPVVSYDEQMVQGVADDLEKKGVVWKSGVSRVSKYEERFTHERDLLAREASVLCVLFLRGCQTIGDLRGRTARLYKFESLDEVHEVLKNLEEWGYVQRLPRMPGHKESRYTHLLSGEPETTEVTTPPAVASDTVMDAQAQRVAKLETDMAVAQDELEALKAEFAAFKKQFE